MFTGIIESTAKIVKKTDAGLVVARPSIFDDLKIGCSIAVSGVCLSVTTFDEATMSFDVVPTTLEKSKLGSLKIGDTVNLERAMKADGRFEGHIVTGHSEGVGSVVSHALATGEGDTKLSLRISKNLLPFVVLHGSITLDGVALTVAGFQGDIVTVALIPHTLEKTTFGHIKIGDVVNIETDIIGKYILHAHVPRT